MTKGKHDAQQSFMGVMVSSTFKDLEGHRGKIIDAINGQDMKAIAMEYDTTKPDADIISSSLQMVQRCSGYVCIIGYEYGQIPRCSKRNRQKHSITELEFREARRLKRPSLIFIMGDNHPVPKRVLDEDRTHSPELERFKSLCQKGSIYTVFDDLPELERKAIQSVAKLQLHLFKEEERRRQQRLLCLFEMAKTGLSIEGIFDMTEFELTVLRHVSRIASENSKDRPQ